MPKGADRTELALSDEELREVRLALALRIAALGKTDTRKMGPNAKVKLRRQLDVCHELQDQVRKLRGK